jgi:hypothetical protein
MIRKEYSGIELSLSSILSIEWLRLLALFISVGWRMMRQTPGGIRLA